MSKLDGARRGAFYEVLAEQVRNGYFKENEESDD
jgi:hypothetical protein